MTISILFFSRNGTRDNFSNFSQKFLEVFALPETFSTAQKKFNFELTALRFVRSKNRRNRSHPHDFSAISSFEKVVLVFRCLNLQGGYKIEMAI